MMRIIIAVSGVLLVQPGGKLGLFPELEIVNVDGMQAQQSLCIVTEVVVSGRSVLTTRAGV